MNRFDNLPTEIARKLEESVRRVRRILIFRGLCVTVAVAVAALLGIMAIDAMIVIFSSAVRWTLWSVGVIAVVATFLVAFVRPLRRRLSAAEVATLIERNHPELEERLSTVVELIQQGDDGASARLMEAITLDAVRDVGTLSPENDLKPRTVKPRLVAALVALGVLGALFVVFPQATFRLAARALLPAIELDNIYASGIRVTPGDRILLEGTPFTVNVAVDAGFPDRVFMRTCVDGGDETVERMTRISALDEVHAFYSFDYPSVDQSFSYRVNCGNALTRAYRVTVVKMPSFDDLRIRVEHPAYTGRKPDEFTGQAAITALSGSKVTVSVRPSRDDITGAVNLPRNRTVEGTRDADGRLNFVFPLGDDDSGAWSIALGDQYGFSNQVAQTGIVVTKDEPPKLVVTEPEEKSLELPTYGQIPFAYEIEEDYAIASAVLEMSTGSRAFTNVLDLACESAGDRRWTGFTSFELASAHITDGFLRLRLAVTDNCPPECGGPHVVRSAEYSVKVTTWAKTLDAKELSAEIKAAKQDIEEAKRALKTAKHKLDEAAERIDGEESWKKRNGEESLEAAEKNLVKAEELLKKVATTDEDDLLSAAREEMKPVVDEHVTPDRQQAEDLRMADKQEKRSEPSKELANRIDEAMKALDDAQKRFEATAREAEETQRLAEMAERETALAALAEQGELSAADLADRQRELEQRFESEFRDELNDPMANNEREAQAFAEKAGKLAEKRESIDAMKEGNAKRMSEENFRKELDRFAGDADRFAEKASKELGEAIPKTDTDNMPGEKQKWDGIREKFEQKGLEMRGEDAKSFEEARDQMQQALENARASAESEKKAAQQQSQSQQQSQQQLQQQSQQQSQQQAQQQFQQQSQQQMQSAIQQMQAAAQAMKSQAQQNAEKMNKQLEQFLPDSMQSFQNERGEPTDSRSRQDFRTRQQRRRAEQQQLEKALDGEADWFKMKSESSSNAETMNLNDVPSEYRELVREYFKALNEGGRK